VTLPAPAALSVLPVTGIGEIGAGDDLADMIVRHFPALHGGDVVVVSSKIVSKAEGRTLLAPDREAAITAETVRLVARRRDTRIVETRQGLVMAAAGVDASNVEPGVILLLPVDPDASARTIRAGVRDRLGVDVAVVVTDSIGRPWRQGVVDIAIGVAGLAAAHDLRGGKDSYGNLLEVTVVAVADEIAAAAELVKTKLGAVPVVVVRGLEGWLTPEDGPGARALLRPAADDMFSLGTAEAMRAAVTSRRTVREFTAEPVDPAAVDRAIAAALTAPAPHHSTPFRFRVLTGDAKYRFLDALRDAWTADLRGDDFTPDQITRRLRRGDVLRRAPLVIVPCVTAEAWHTYPDVERNAAERDMFIAAGGGAVQSLLIALSAEGLGSCWVSSTLFCAAETRAALNLPADWHPLGAVGVGVAGGDPRPRPALDLDTFRTWSSGPGGPGW
jgi:coenzyme F420-0:L-glutamate ligase/coenzyme F420-1:gamma-L-glutamate ligase